MREYFKKYVKAKFWKDLNFGEVLRTDAGVLATMTARLKIKTQFEIYLSNDRAINKNKNIKKLKLEA